jgi:hypothetical protein
MLERVTPELVGSMLGADAERWASFWSMHLHLEEMSATETETTFVIGSGAVLTDEGPVSVEVLCAALGRGLAARGWEEMGTFEARDGAIVHRLPRSE